MLGYVVVQPSPVLIGSPKPIPRPYHCLACEVWGYGLPPQCWNCGSSDVKVEAVPAGGVQGALSPGEERATVDA